MPALIVIGLVLAVLWAAGRSSMGPAGAAASIPGGNASQIPAGGISGPISPAMSGGSPLLTATNQVRLDVTAPNVWHAGPVSYLADARQQAGMNAVQSGPTSAPATSPLPSSQPTSPLRQDAYPTLSILRKF
jgi:hypothetical protein